MQTSLLPFFGVIRVSGDDRASFLHGQLSNHIEALTANQACYATYNTPKGRVIANMLVINRGNDLLLITAADMVEALVKRLRMFVMRAKVIFEPLDSFAVAGELANNTSAQPATEPHLTFDAKISNGLCRINLPHSGILLVGEQSTLPAHDAAAENAWNSHEILSGYPWICAATKETCVAQMLNQHTIGGVHFKKGCYPGQEIIARAQYRGQVKRGLTVLAGSSLETAGIAIQNNGEEVGLVINSALTAEGSISLAVIKHSATEAPLTDADGNVLKQQALFFNVENGEE